MALRSALPSTPRLRSRCNRGGLGKRQRHYATIKSVNLVGRSPGPPQNVIPPPTMALVPSVLDALVLTELRNSRSPQLELPSVVQSYEDSSGTVLETPLPYESRPSKARRVTFDGSDGIVMVAHAIQHGEAHKVALCTGFVLNASHAAAGESENEMVVVTCAHTLEEMRNAPLFASLTSITQETAASSVPLTRSTSGSFVLTSSPEKYTPVFHPVNNVLSALHRSDLLLLSTSTTPNTIRSLPVSPYPAQPGAAIRAHVVIHKQPDEEGWRPWIGGTWSQWVSGTILGYRDFAGREAKPGTYDALTHMLFKPLPTPGSSGGPIIDEESGSVVGVMLGTRMDNRVEGLRGWGVPSETIFEMFGLPGLNLHGR